MFSPLPCYIQSMDKLDEIITEIAAILNPELFPGYKLSFFLELPETDAEGAKLKEKFSR